MPAVAQIEMIRAMLQLQSGWGSVITGGSKLKFTGLVQPGDTVTIQLQYTPHSEIRFTIEKDTILVSKGILELAGGSNA